MEKFTHSELIERQKQKSKQHLPFCVVLNNIRSLYNVGSIFRTSDGVGVDKLWICGVTGHPPRNQIAKTALGAQDVIPWEYRKDILSLIHELRAENYQIVLLEQTKESVPYEKFQPRFPVCLVLGNEIEGVHQDLLSYCDQSVEIEMEGVKNSLKVSVAFGIVAFHFRNCYKN